MSSLRERIAALQQRSTSPSPQSQGKPLPATQSRISDKIANFERKGGAPVPRGSFGLGAPPPQSRTTSKELYGNRFASQPMTAAELNLHRSSSSKQTASINHRERRISSHIPDSQTLERAGFYQLRSGLSADDVRHEIFEDDVESQPESCHSPSSSGGPSIPDTPEDPDSIFLGPKTDASKTNVADQDTADSTTLSQSFIPSSNQHESQPARLEEHSSSHSSEATPTRESTPELPRSNLVDPTSEEPARELPSLRLAHQESPQPITPPPEDMQTTIQTVIPEIVIHISEPSPDSTLAAMNVSKTNTSTPPDAPTSPSEVCRSNISVVFVPVNAATASDNTPNFSEGRVSTDEEALVPPILISQDHTTMIEDILCAPEGTERPVGGMESNDSIEESRLNSELLESRGDFEPSIPIDNHDGNAEKPGMTNECSVEESITEPIILSSSPQFSNNLKNVKVADSITNQLPEIGGLVKDTDTCKEEVNVHEDQRAGVSKVVQPSTPSTQAKSEPAAAELTSNPNSEETTIPSSEQSASLEENRGASNPKRIRTKRFSTASRTSSQSSVEIRRSVSSKSVDTSEEVGSVLLYTQRPNVDDATPTPTAKSFLPSTQGQGLAIRLESKLEDESLSEFKQMDFFTEETSFEDLTLSSPGSSSASPQKKSPWKRIKQYMPGHLRGNSSPNDGMSIRSLSLTRLSSRSSTILEESASPVTPRSKELPPLPKPDPITVPHLLDLKIDNTVIDLPTPDIMALFPDVPTSPPRPPLPNIPERSSMFLSAPTSPPQRSQSMSAIRRPPPQPSPPARRKSTKLVPGWYTDDDFDEEGDGWADVVVTSTKKYHY